MFTLNCKGRLFIIDGPVVMGIINITPDSFYAGSRFHTMDDVLHRAEKMLQEGAAILDIGGQSTRPNSQLISKDEELQRVVPFIEAIIKRFPEAIISVDTFYGKVAEYAIAAGASIVNDVSAGTMDEELWPIIAKWNVPYILMHIKGTPQTMQQYAQYDNVVTDVFDMLNLKIHQLRRMGINDIIADIGFGFAKNSTHNFQLLKHLNYFQQLNVPLLAGLSRKATIYKALGITAADALNGTTVLHTIALLNGAHILRVHDVKEAVEAIKLVKAYNNVQEV